MATGKLKRIASDLYCLDSRFTVWGCSGSTRMTVVATGDGLVLYSPVSLDAEDIAEIRAIGPVRAIIAPNLYHHLYLRAAMSAFPSARVLVPAGLESKIGEVPRAETISDGSDLGLPAGIDHHIITGHAIRETSLFHRPTGTLITADLLYNFQREQLLLEKAVFGMMGIYGRPGVPFYHRFAIEDKSSVRHLIEKVRSWPLRRIIPCHGRVVERDDAAEIFASAWERFA